jgi:hypothetical protein
LQSSYPRQMVQPALWSERPLRQVRM